MTTKTISKSKVKTTQTFIRLNVDAKLDNLLKKYESKYQLLNRGDLIRMLLSEVDFIKSNPPNSANQFFTSLDPQDDGVNEQEALDISNQLLGR